MRGKTHMNIEFDVYKQKLNEVHPGLLALADSLNIEGLKNELERLHAMQEAPGFWDNPEKSQQIVMKTKSAENKIETYNRMLSSWEDLMTICEMAAEEDDDSMLEELKDGFQKLTENMETCRLETLLTGKYDKNNAMMSFQAGAGGTEAQDWCQMLYRMYTRWAEAHGYTYKILDYLEGDEAGLKSATIMIEGINAYGYLKSENGVHRLVRVSPFDSSGRRHTSFASVEVMPEFEDDAEIVLKDEDLEITAHRSSGAGGQHINKTDSAIRIVHKPTGIVVTCQTERSQLQNKETAMKMLKSKLMEIKIRERLEAGDVTGAAGMLGYDYSLHGVIVAGNRLGRTIGFPTANMQLYEPLKLVPGNGVYFVKVSVLGRSLYGMCNIGCRPTVGAGNARTIETNIFGFDEDIYGLDMELTFVARIREERKFDSMLELKAQLEHDRDLCLGLLSTSLSS